MRRAISAISSSLAAASGRGLSVATLENIAFGLGDDDVLRQRARRRARHRRLLAAIALPPAEPRRLYHGKARHRIGPAAAGALKRRQWISRGAVVEAEHDDAFGVGHELQRIGPPLEGLGHPGHVAMRACPEPGGKTLARLRRRHGRCDPAGVEAERAGLFAQKRQKSRFA